MVEIILKQEEVVQKRIDKIKKLIFGSMIGLTENLISYVMGFFIHGLVVAGISTIICVSVDNILEYRPVRKFRLLTCDCFIDSLYKKREPLYVITKRIKYTVDKLLTE